MVVSKLLNVFVKYMNASPFSYLRVYLKLIMYSDFTGWTFWLAGIVRKGRVQSSANNHHSDCEVFFSATGSSNIVWIRYSKRIKTVCVWVWLVRPIYRLIKKDVCINTIYFIFSRSQDAEIDKWPKDKYSKMQYKRNF